MTALVMRKADQMNSTLMMVVALLACVAVTSCVNVTTARQSSSVSEGPDGQLAKESKVEVRTYGWNVFEALLHVVVFPFKVACHGVKWIL